MDIETDSAVDLVVPLSGSEEFYDAAEAEVVGHTGDGASVGVGQSARVGQSVGASASRPIGVSTTPSVVRGFGGGDSSVRRETRGDILGVGLPAEVTAPVSSTSSEPSGLFGLLSQTLWPSFLSPRRTADRSGVTTTSAGHPSAASAERVAHSVAVPTQYCVGQPSRSVDDLSASPTSMYGPSMDHGYAVPQLATTSVGAPYHATHLSACPPSASPAVDRSVSAHPFVDAAFASQPAAPVGMLYVPSPVPSVGVGPQQATMSVGAPYHAAHLSACPPSASPAVGQSVSVDVRVPPATGYSPQARGTPVAERATDTTSFPASESVEFPEVPRSSMRDSTAAVQRSTRPLVKLAPYDGTGSLETFLAKFQNIARYLEWTEEDRFFHLCASLEGTAGQVLWDAGPQATTDSVIRLLQMRFGNELQAERFKAELRARRRKPGEPLQHLYQEVCRLVALAYPSAESSLVHHVAKETFISALDSPSLQLKLMEREPKTVEDALNLAVKLEAYEKSLSVSGRTEEFDQERGHPRRKKLYAVNENDGVSPSLQQQVTTLQEALLKVTQRLDDLNRDTGRASAPSSTVTPVANSGEQSSVTPHLGAVPPLAVDRGKTRRRQDKAVDPCNVCKQLGHWARECPQRKAQPVVLGVTPQREPPRHIYVLVTYRGRPLRCLLDTGCERSIIGSKYVKGLPLMKTNIVLYAANKTELPVDGDIDLHFAIAGQPISYNVSVSPVIDELILGSDWLTHSKCQWDFATGKLTLNGQVMPTYRQEQLAFCRRIFVREVCTVPPKHEANIPVRMMYDGARCVKTDWAVEPRVLRTGVTTARTLVSDDSVDSVARILNYSEEPYTLEAGSFLAMAEPVDAIGDGGTARPPACLSTSAGGLTRSTRSRRKSCGPTSGRVMSTHASLPTSEDEHVQCLIDKLLDDLTPDQRTRATQFIRANAHLFSKSEFDIGRTDVLKHRIDTEDRPPHYEPLRRHPTSQLPLIDQHVEAMLRHDVIEPAASPWCSNVVMVKKRDGTMRFCVDYRKTNDLIKKDKFPLPKIDTCLDTLNGCKYFSSCDLRQGYWQTMIEESDRDKTAFVTRKGQWRFKVLSFGLCNAPSQFARTMELVLSGLTWDICLVYLDDILVFSKTFEEHCDRLAAVFGRLGRHTLKLKPAKCHLFQRAVTFLGHVVSEEGIQCDPDKVAAIATWPRPMNTTEVRTFCGLASYYRSFVQDFARIAGPLHELTRKNVAFGWNEDRERAFQELKHRLTSAPILVAPRDEGTFVLDTDASDTALGAVLQQQQDGVLRVIGYASRSLSDAERRYCITRKELLGVVYGLKKYRQYLLGRPIIVRTDHAALTYLKKTPEPIGQQGRWLDLLGEFDITIQHRPGRVHGNSDALSRRPCDRDGGPWCKQCTWSPQPAVPSTPSAAVHVVDAVSTSDQPANVSAAVTVSEPGQSNTTVKETEPDTEVLLSSNSVRAAQAADDELSTIIELVTNQAEPDPATIREYPETARILIAQWTSLVVIEGVLYRRFHLPDGSTHFLQVVLPASLRRPYIERLHAELGHFGQAKTCAAVARRVYFPGWRSYTNLLVRSCTVCNLHQRNRQPPRQTPLRPMREFRPMAVLHADLVGPLPEGRNDRNQRGFCYILSVVDSATRYLWLVPLRRKTADAVAAALFDEVITKVSVPSAILSDLGGEFMGDVMAQLCERLGIDRLHTSAYHPQTDAKCERLHFSLHNMIVKLVDEQHDRWPDLLGTVALAYNSSVHTATGYSPHELFYSFRPSCPLDVMVDRPAEDPAEDADSYALQAAERLQAAYKFMRGFTKRQAERMKKSYDASIRPKVFEEGAFVLLFSPKRKRGVYSRWQVTWLGPYRVIRRLNSTNYVVQKSPRSKTFIVHADRLKLYHGTPTHSSWLAEAPAGPVEAGTTTADIVTSADQPTPRSAHTRRPSRRPCVGQSVTVSPLVGQSASAGPPAVQPTAVTCQQNLGVAAPTAAESQRVDLQQQHVTRPRRCCGPPRRYRQDNQITLVRPNESNMDEEARRRKQSAARRQRSRQADHVRLHCQLCENPTTVYETVTGLNRHCVIKHDCTYRAKGNRYVPLDRDDIGPARDRVRSAQRPRRRRRPRGDPADKPNSSSRDQSLPRATARRVECGHGDRRAAADWSPSPDRRPARHRQRSDNLTPTEPRSSHHSRRCSPWVSQRSPSSTTSIDSSEVRGSPVSYRASGQAGPPRADLDDVSSDISDLCLSPGVEEEIAGAWEGELLQPEDLELSASPPVGQSASDPIRMSASPPTAAASAHGTAHVQYVPPPPPTSPPAEASGSVPRAPEQPEPPPMSPPPESPPPQPVGPDRPNLVLRDLLTAVQHARPTDIHSIVELLTQQFNCRHAPRELALILSGVFVGRQGFARELRDLALAGGLNGLPANVVLTAALAHMENSCGQMSDDQLW